MKTLRHVGIVVSNLNKSLHFYKDLLGLRVVRDARESGDCIDRMLQLSKVRVHTIKLSCDEGESLIELLYFSSHSQKTRKIYPYSIGFTHVAFLVLDLDKLYKKLKRSRVKFTTPPEISPDDYVKVTFCKDPDGNLVELVELLKK